MRPWFTLIVVCILAICLLISLFIVDFVLLNREMFEQPFTIVIRFPFSGWSHTWESVQFVYIIAASVLIGALLIAITTLGLDTKRMLKLRGMRKELKRLQQALQEAQSLHEVKIQEEQELVSQVEEESSELHVSPPASPEEISKSFEDTIEKDDFLETSKKRREEEESEKELHSEETDIRERVTGASDAEPTEQKVEVKVEPTEQEVEAEEESETEAEGESLGDAGSEQERSFLEEAPVEAEIVEEKKEEEEQVQQSDKRNV